MRRQVEFVVRTCEWILGRNLRDVLDVGCGEGSWQPELKRLRPRVHYDGVDPSEYAVKRYGNKRNIKLGDIGTLNELSLRDSYDLVVCCGMLNYLSLNEFRIGIENVAKRTRGVAYLEIFADGDLCEGDTSWTSPQKSAWYRRVIEDAGLLAVGMQCYVAADCAANISLLERSTAIVDR